MAAKGRLGEMGLAAFAFLIGLGMVLLGVLVFLDVLNTRRRGAWERLGPLEKGEGSG